MERHDPFFSFLHSNLFTSSRGGECDCASSFATRGLCCGERGRRGRNDTRDGRGLDSDKPGRLVDWLYDDGCHRKKRDGATVSMHSLTEARPSSGKQWGAFPSRARDDWSEPVFILTKGFPFLGEFSSWQGRFRGEWFPSFSFRSIDSSLKFLIKLNRSCSNNLN